MLRHDPPPLPHTQAELVDARVTSKKWTQERITIRFAQEVYNQTGRLIAMHEKFPVDLGHKQL